MSVEARRYLNDREKKIVLIVLILQVVDNIALVVFEETAPGSRAWLTWRDVLHLVDIICCCAILMPIVWSIRHLREAAAADGKAADTVGKLTLFRQFYIMVVAHARPRRRLPPRTTRRVDVLLRPSPPPQTSWPRWRRDRSCRSFHVAVARAAATVLRGISTSWPRRRRDPSHRNIHVVAAAAPRPVSAESPRRGRGDPSPRNIHGVAAA